MDRIDPFFYARSSRIDLKDETRIKATSQEAATWLQENQAPGGMSFLPAKNALTSPLRSSPA
jgi:ubiquitin conjugation factor E4 B